MVWVKGELKSGVKEWLIQKKEGRGGPSVALKQILNV